MPGQTYVLIAPADDLRAFRQAEAVAHADGLTEYRSMPMVYHEWSAPDDQPPPAPPWWQTAPAGAAVTTTRAGVPVYLSPGGADWGRPGLPLDAGGLQIWGSDGEWARVLRDSPPRYPTGLWVRASDLRMK